MGLLGRQAIHDDSGTVRWYDILYRKEKESSEIEGDAAISASVLDRILHTFGTELVLGTHDGFLKVDADFLGHALIRALPKERFILSLLQPSLGRAGLLERVEALHAEGYRFALNDLAAGPELLESIRPLLPYVDYVKIDTLAGEQDSALDACRTLAKLGKTVIASKVEEDHCFTTYRNHGVRYFQGYYFARPNIIENDSLNARQEEILRIWNMIEADASANEIEAAIEENHTLALQLMRFINSSFFSFSRRITSIVQIINLLGRQSLSGWLLLMMSSPYSKEGANHPLVLMVINRTEIMKSLAELTARRPDRSTLQTAYLVGMLSLIHLLLNLDHRTFLHKLNVSDEIENAMFEATSYWGELLTMTRYIEHTDMASLMPFIEKYDLDKEKINAIVVGAMERVNAFEAMLESMSQS